jgi:hypothetical protein
MLEEVICRTSEVKSYVSKPTSLLELGFLAVNKMELLIERRIVDTLVRSLAPMAMLNRSNTSDTQRRA